jgi:hypothetical protein
MSFYETEKSFIIKTQSEEKMKEIFTYADFKTYCKICVPKNKLTKYIIQNEKNVLKLLTKVEDIKKNNLKYEDEEKKDYSAPRWDNSRDGLKYPWVIFKISASPLESKWGDMEITLPENFLDLSELIITNLLENIISYEIKNFENTETIKINFILKKATDFVK